MERALAYRASYFKRAGIAGLVLTAAGLASSGLFEPLDGRNPVTYGLLLVALAEILFFGLYSFDAARVAARVERAREQGAEATQRESARRVPFRFRARRLVGTDAPESLEQVGRLLATMGAAFVLHPLLFGVVAVTVSGEAWRDLIFLPVAGMGGVVYWERIGAALRTLEETAIR